MFLDFEQIKKDNDIVDVAKQLGLNLLKKQDQLRGRCPSGDGGDRGFVITPAKQAWYSFAAKKGGDVIALVSFVKGIPAKEAAHFLAGDTRPEKKQKSVQGDERGFKALDYLIADHEAVQALNLDTVDAERFGIGYAPRGVMRGHVAFPIRNASGELAGYVGVTKAKLPSAWKA